MKNKDKPKTRAPSIKRAITYICVFAVLISVFAVNILAYQGSSFGTITYYDGYLYSYFNNSYITVSGGATTRFYQSGSYMYSGAIPLPNNNELTTAPPEEMGVCEAQGRFPASYNAEYYLRTERYEQNASASVATISLQDMWLTNTAYRAGLTPYAGILTTGDNSSITAQVYISYTGYKKVTNDGITTYNSYDELKEYRVSGDSYVSLDTALQLMIGDTDYERYQIHEIYTEIALFDTSNGLYHKHLTARVPNSELLGEVEDESDTTTYFRGVTNKADLSTIITDLPLIIHPDVELTTVGEFLGNALDGFFDFELYNGITLGAVFFAVVAFCIVFMVLRFFAGG